jgi:DNA-binding GntR family transcriptional regulator
MDNLETYLSQQTEQTTDTPRLLREIAYDRIKDAIRHADLKPGYPLSETHLSKLLGISRTPVREAIQQLSQEGLVHVIPGRAVTVAAPSVQEVLNAVHVRSILEPEVARLIAMTISPADLEGLWGALHGMEEAIENDDRTAWAKADTRFHEILSDACPNQLLGELVIQVRNRIAYLASDSQTDNNRIIACTKEHREIVEAIDARDPQEAATVMREHIDLLRESLFRRLTHS